MRLALLALLLAFAGPALAQERWVAGDLHEHVSPPDGKGEVSATFSACVTTAKESGISFLVFTPHLRGEWWRTEKGVAKAARDLADLDARCRSVKEICAIPGLEDTESSGHVGVAFVSSRVLEAIL